MHISGTRAESQSLMPRPIVAAAAAAAAKSLQLCPTLSDPINGSPPGSPLPGILQARTLAWVAISFSNAWKGKVKVKSLSGARLLATPWTAAHQAPPSMGFSRQEYWSRVQLPSPAQDNRRSSYCPMLSSFSKKMPLFVAAQSWQEKCPLESGEMFENKFTSLPISQDYQQENQWIHSTMSS